MARPDLERKAIPIQKARRFAELVAISRDAENPDLAWVDRRQRWLEEKIPIRIRRTVAFDSGV